MAKTGNTGKPTHSSFCRPCLSIQAAANSEVQGGWAFEASTAFTPPRAQGIKSKPTTADRLSCSRLRRSQTSPTQVTNKTEVCQTLAG